MKKSITLICLFMSVLGLSQAERYKTIVQNDSVKQVLTFSADSTLIKLAVFQLDVNSGEFALFQTIQYDNLGRIVSFYSYYGVRENEDGYIEYDEIVVDLDKKGKPKRLMFTNKFEWVKKIIYDNKSKRYKNFR